MIGGPQSLFIIVRKLNDIRITAVLWEVLEGNE